MEQTRISWWKWMLRLVLGIILAGLGYGLAMIPSASVENDALRIVLNFGIGILLIVLYGLLVKAFEKKVEDLPLRRLAPDTGIGLLTGLGYFIVVVGLMMLFGLYRPGGVSWNGTAQLSAFSMFFVVAAGEEILFRGILFRLFDRQCGTVIALTASALVFGLSHIGNEGATWWSSVAIAVEAGLLLAAAYKYSRSLWLPVGIHWAWNYVQGNIFGFEVSGQKAGESLFHPQIAGPDLLTGGAFGAEASLIAVLVGAALSAWLIYRIYRNKPLAASAM